MALSRQGRDFAYVGTLGERAIAQVRVQVGKGKMVCGLSGCWTPVSSPCRCTRRSAISCNGCLSTTASCARTRASRRSPVPRPLQHPASPRRREQAVPRRARRHDRTREERKTIGALFIDVFEAEAKKTALSRRKATLDATNGASDPVQLLFDAAVARHGRQGGQQILEIADEGHVVEVSPVGETALHDRAQQVS